METRRGAATIWCTQRGVTLMAEPPPSRRHNARCGSGRCDGHRCALPCRPSARAQENAMPPLPSYNGEPVIIIGNGPVGRDRRAPVGALGHARPCPRRPARAGPRWLESHLPAAGGARCLGGGRRRPPAGQRGGDVVDGSDLLYNWLRVLPLLLSHCRIGSHSLLQAPSPFLS